MIVLCSQDSTLPVRQGVEIFTTSSSMRTTPTLNRYPTMGICVSEEKSDLLSCTESCCIPQTDAPVTDAIILDGAAVVNMVRHNAAKTFDDYALKVFVPYIQSQLEKANRVDIVWDEYIENSLKSHTRQKRGKGDKINPSCSLSLQGM